MLLFFTQYTLDVAVLCEKKAIDAFEDFIKELLYVAWVSNLAQNLDNFLI
jgi:hypothetical protein